MSRRWLVIGCVVLASFLVVALGARNSRAEATGFTNVALNAASCEKGGLGIDASYSALIFENAFLSFTDFPRRVAVGGNAGFHNSTIGFGMAESGERVDLDVRGEVSFVGGAVPRGLVSSIRFAQSESPILAFAPVHNSNSGVEHLKTKVSRFVSQLNALNAHGQFNLHNPLGARHEVFLHASDMEKNVFVLDSNDIANAHTIRIEGSESGSVLVIVKGDSVQLTALTFEYLGVRKENVLLFFPQANLVRMRSLLVPASVLAPLAKVELANTVLEGQLVANNVVGQAEFRNNVFEGCL